MTGEPVRPRACGERHRQRSRSTAGPSLRPPLVRGPGAGSCGRALGAGVLVLASLLPACVAYVDYGAGGYQRAGVWLPHRDEPRYEGEVPPPSVDAAALEWHGDLGVYRVRGEPCTFYRLRVFYRWSDGEWQAATMLDGSWQRCDRDVLPAGLRTDPAVLCAEEASAPP